MIHQSDQPSATGREVPTTSRAPLASPSLNRLLISHITLRGPEIEQVYEQVASAGSQSYEQLAMNFIPGWQPDATFALAEATFREALNFLLVAGMVEQSGDSRRKATFLAAPGILTKSFPLLLLAHLNTHPDQRQHAIALVFKQMVSTDTLSTSARDLRAQLERGPYQSLFTWTGEKIFFWSQLAAHIGLVRRLDRTFEIVAVPQPGLLMAALEHAASAYYLQSGGVMPIYTLLEIIDNTLFACFTRKGSVATGIAQCLVAMHRRGDICLTHSTDAAHSLLLGDWRVSNIRFEQSEEGAQ